MGRGTGYGVAVIALAFMCLAVIWPFSRHYAEAEFFHEQALKIANPDMLSTIIILPDNKEDWNAAEEIITRISSLPDSLLKKIAASGIKVRLFTGQLTDQPEAAHLKGVMPRGYTNTTWDDVPGMGGGRTVYVKVGCSDIGMGHDSVNLELHELAHSIDSIVLSNRSHSGLFEPIWQAEANQLFPGRDYFLHHPEEYFAEAFTLYFYHAETRKKLYEEAPMTYEFFKQLESNQFA